MLAVVVVVVAMAVILMDDARVVGIAAAGIAVGGIAWRYDDVDDGP